MLQLIYKVFRIIMHKKEMNFSFKKNPEIWLSLSLGELIFSVDEKTRHQLWWKSMKKVWNICGYQPNEFKAWTMSIIDNKERRPQKTTSIEDLDPLLSATMSSTFNSLQRLHIYMRFIGEGMIKRTILLLLQYTRKEAWNIPMHGYTVKDVLCRKLQNSWLWIF